MGWLGDVIAWFGDGQHWQGPDGVPRPFTRMRPGEPGTDTWLKARNVVVGRNRV